jgi:cytochrome c oxidase subunit 4
MGPGVELHGATRRTYVLVWLGLLLLTGVTVSVAGVNLGRLSVLIVLVIAGIKSTLVLLYFMHLKYEKGFLFMLIMPGTVFLLILFIGFVFTDIAFR